MTHLHQLPTSTPKAVLAVLVPCRVVIRMEDGSRGEHLGLYRHGFDALNRALELFPAAKSVCVTVRRKAAQ